MADVTEVWFNPSCSKCRIAKEAIDESGASYSLRRYLDDPPTRDELVDVLGKLGLQPWDITRTGDDLAKELGVASMPKERDAWLDLLAANPSLIQRPIIVTSDGKAVVARTPEALKALGL